MQARHSAIKLRVRLFLMLLAIASGVALALFSNSAANRTAAQSNYLDKIAFSTDAQMLIVNPDGSGLVPFHPGAGDEFESGFDPSWSTTETGQGKIAFAYGPREISRIAIANEDGTNPVDLMPSSLATRTSQPDLAPGATKVAFVNEVLETDPTPHSRIYIVDANGQNFRPLYTGNVRSNMDHEFAPAWSPDGTKIAFIGVENAFSTMDIYVADANGQTSPLQITNFRGSAFSLGQLSWSPDGQKLAFSYGQDIYTVNTDGSNGLINLTNAASSRESVDPAWSPDGRKIAYSTLFDLYVMDADGHNQVAISPGGSLPSWRWRTVTPEPTPSPSPSPNADLATIELSAAPDPGRVGQDLTYTMVVRNHGPSAAERVEAGIVRSASLQLVSATPAQGSCGPDGSPLRCQLGSLAAGTQTAIEFVFRATVAEQVVVFSGVGSQTPDANVNNNGRQLFVTVGAADSCVPEVGPVQQAILRLGSQTQRTVRHIIALRNDTGRAISGDVHLVFDGLQESVQSGDPRNAFSRTQCAQPLGRKYLTLRRGNTVWRRGQVILAYVEFSNPQRVRINYRLRTYNGSGTL